MNNYYTLSKTQCTFAQKDTKTPYLLTKMALCFTSQNVAK